ncbi:hypothetical protein P1X15_05010 [Runella sp. MFBS21]|uniref:hypothetical protein n=1 Tax=Runella sp. MFBS21 TaxID=3034018 RepID=UPI0023F8382E|nr:hypothetical protein [Runella sp. MFBS21]MDF7816940.1 hypothetical protein [Runella sp. MFBS21]
MKKIIFSILFSILFLTGYSQKPCHEYTLNEQEKVVVSSYIMTCVHGHWFVNNKGVVKITRFVNEKGEKCWYLVAVIDDRYKDNPPTEYAWCNADLVFFYESVETCSYSEKKLRLILSYWPVWKKSPTTNFTSARPPKHSTSPYLGNELLIQVVIF